MQIQHSPLMGMAWKRPALHQVPTESHNQEFLLLLAPPLGVMMTVAAVAVGQVAGLPHLQLLGGHASLRQQQLKKLQLEQLKLEQLIHLQVLQSLAT